MSSFTLTKAERLLNRKDFVNLNHSGKRLYTTHCVVIFGRNGLGNTRLGITVSRKRGNAVKRNRFKRYVREFFRLNKDRLPHGYDIVVSAKKHVGELDFRKVGEELGALILDKKRSL